MKQLKAITLGLTADILQAEKEKPLICKWLNTEIVIYNASSKEKISKLVDIQKAHENGNEYVDFIFESGDTGITKKALTKQLKELNYKKYLSLPETA